MIGGTNMGTETKKLEKNPCQVSRFLLRAHHSWKNLEFFGRSVV